MLGLRIYYSLKPYTPWKLRMGLRRLLAAWIRIKNAETWPINPTAGQRPDKWSGWPNDKDFAFVLSHDVEGEDGIRKVQTLAEIELQLGFRSSFNFVPEGGYNVPYKLREWLAEHGFEVGVHDLHHDGKLYKSKSQFVRNAEKINAYLKEWKADGYRSGFMLHNLDWHHELNVLYDSSTFDTDPFEPQPTGANTIFPFFVPRKLPGDDPASPSLKAPLGYIELPYTLPQDSTLFILLRETTDQIWQRKLDWICRHGGMAMLNVHPDYISFGDASNSPTYPLKLYMEFLLNVKEKYANRYWHALPRDVAQFYKKSISVSLNDTQQNV